LDGFPDHRRDLDGPPRLAIDVDVNESPDRARRIFITAK
jgi:hypothetical protein